VIRKLLVFALLLALGFVALDFAIEGDMLPGAHSSAGNVKESASDQGSGIGIEDKSRNNLNVRVAAGGRLSIPSFREAALDGGTIRRLLVYELNAEDSAPVADDLYRLEDVRVDLYESAGTPQAPESVRAGTLHAAFAFVRIGRDAKGAPSVVADKDVELANARLETEPHSRSGALRLEIERAVARWSEDAIRIRTATPAQRFDLVTLGDAPLTLTGEGLDADLPTGREPGRTIRVRVNRRPVLVQTGPRGRSELRAQGPLEYVEAGGHGLAVVTASDEVTIDGLQRAGEEPLRASGDAVRAVLWRRGRAGASSVGGDGVAWRSLRLQGSPAHLHVRGHDLACTRLDVTPSAHGDPYLFTASGEPRLTSVGSGEPLVFRAAQRIHVVRLREHLGRLLAPLGFPGAGLGTSASELVIFEGISSAQTGTLELRAADGLLVLGALSGSGPVTVVGRGAVSVRDTAGDGLHVEGNLGLALHRDALGNERIRLGPQQPDPRHAFVVRRGDLALDGHGACSLRRPADPAAAGGIELESPAGDIAVALAARDASLRRARTLSASFDAGGLRTFDAAGPELALDWRDGDETLTAGAERITSTAPDVYVLRGAPARIVRGTELTIEGQRLTVARIGRESGLIVAEGGAHMIAARGAQAGELELFADRLTFVPALAPLGVLDLHAPRHGRAFVAPGARSRYLFAHGRVRVVAAERDVRDEADGSDLALQFGGDSAAGRLTGAPATIARGGEQPLRGQAPVVLLRGHAGADGLTLLPAAAATPPRVTLVQGDARFARAGAKARPIAVEAAGAIRAERDAVRFSGPVHAFSVADDGSPLPGEFDLRADDLTMDREPDSGAITRVRASGSAALRWGDLTADAEHMWLDLLRNLCTVRDVGGQARFTFADRAEWRGYQAVFDYVTMEVARSWRSRLRGAAGSDGAR
jgi:hypothetical protein